MSQHRNYNVRSTSVISLFFHVLQMSELVTYVHAYLIWISKKGHVVKKINFPSKGAIITFFWTKKNWSRLLQSWFRIFKKINTAEGGIRKISIYYYVL